MSYRMSQRDYVISATYMSVVLLLQFVIHLGVLGTHDTRLLHVVEVELECIVYLGR
jgi:hypothetical protein